MRRRRRFGLPSRGGRPCPIRRRSARRRARSSSRSRFRNLTVKNRILRSSIGGRCDNYDGSGTRGAHQLGPEVRARRRRRDHLLERADRIARGRLLSRATRCSTTTTRFRSGASSAGASTSTTASTSCSSSHAGRERHHRRASSTRRALELDRRAGAAQRLPVRAADGAARSRSIVGAFAAGARRAREAGARRGRARRRERRCSSRSSSARRSTTARTSTAARSRTARASRSRSCARSAPRSATTSASASRSASREQLRELLPWLRDGQHARGVAAGLPLARGGRRRLHPRQRRQRASRTRATRPATSRAKDVVTTYDSADLERHATRSATTSSSAGGRSNAGSRMVAWEKPSRGSASKGSTSPTRARSSRRSSIPVLCTGGFQTASVIAERDRARRLRRRHDRAAAVANPDLVRWFERGHDRAPRPCTLLQQVPLQLRREPARLLRREPLRLARGDDPSRSSPSTSAGVPDGGRMSNERHLRAARVPEPDGQEPGLPLEPRRAGSTTTTARERRRTSTGT